MFLESEKLSVHSQAGSPKPLFVLVSALLIEIHSLKFIHSFSHSSSDNHLKIAVGFHKVCFGDHLCSRSAKSIRGEVPLYMMV